MKKDNAARKKKGTRSFFSEIKEIIDPLPSKKPQQQKRHAPAASSQTWQDRELQNSLEKEYNEKKRETERKPSISKNEITSKGAEEKGADNPSLHVDKQSLVNAIIWSEILGPARSKQSFFQKRH
ncbi:hypothetical protein [Neobacillus terrae]|uniref:hypothetical protein n=1 Tax=Neobacillus terrae TaxID=3034837 RepID=UPI001409B122|nr:hypothetical protein [Neobacillus terrae]NHM30362.1 hypothetical protein [Neobacillus terrae]